MSWAELALFAPHTKQTWESIADSPAPPVLASPPVWLIGHDTSSPADRTWGDFLNARTSSGITNRERLLRFLITRSVADQGSDIAGVEMWHSETFSRLYAEGLPVLDDLTLLIHEFPRILEIADECRQQVTEARAVVWASLDKNRHAAAYSPFTVNGLRGGGDTHWFLTARVFPTLFLAQSAVGGLTEHVFGRAMLETPRQMARRLRNDTDGKLGLSWVMGDKACDLFAKWAVGSWDLSSGLESCLWSPSDCPIPMDQRIGRLMMRCGFMDEFYGVASEMSVASHGFTPRSGQARPKVDDDEIPDGEWHLTVMDFRRSAKVRPSRRPEAWSWLESSRTELHLAPGVENYHPQDVVAILCRSLSRALGWSFTPVHVDDYLMARGGETCHDRDPLCEVCSLERACQANNVASRKRLKNCYT